ncbi:uncharacterized protein BBOV_IV011420 [Babesia bovis T2Bo]|uniref:Uncharacterized protein n=1 Tax=Babesia bovis TaxID=5865 RepID=A7ASH5_BABBO|nr:uncharacterized protein BBOV_IV011420 [Babesia bovis T2Bo]EDO07494.1 hypothetical protein BBOV_IV011420 [Babesia bovis T2Bo]BAN65615.1 hypothetical protein [Babesia bovis]|eukprot:XP_001611062.1 hypothetical protein [Babesia bovis T2Bo]
MATSAPTVSPKHPLLAPKKAPGLLSKVAMPPIKPKAPLISKVNPAVPKKALILPTKATPVTTPKASSAPDVTSKLLIKAKTNAASIVETAKEPEKLPSRNDSIVSNKSAGLEGKSHLEIPEGEHQGLLSMSISHHSSPQLKHRQGNLSIDSVNMADARLNHGQTMRGNQAIGPRDESAMSIDTNEHQMTNSIYSAYSNVKTAEAKDIDCVGAVGATPWLEIERRINEIRALAVSNAPQQSPRRPMKKKDSNSIYSKYNTHYERTNDWKKEVTQPLTYSKVQKLKSSSTAEPMSHERDRWNFVDGFLKPRRKPFASMSELSRHFSNINRSDQSELIKLLLACRSLEKVIEEQHGVLDMLDHDIREARELLRLPEHLRGMSSKTLMGKPPQQESFYPTSDIPLFIKGRVSLIPGPNDIQLSVVNNG